MPEFTEILLKAIIVAAAISAAGAVWVFVSYFAARYTGRPWGLGSDAESCEDSCCGCQMKEACDKTGS